MEKRESVQVHYHVQIESKMSWTIAWHLTLLNAFQLCCNFGTCQRLSLGTSLSSGVEFAIPVLIVFILRKLWFWNAFTWPTTSIQIKWWNFIASWHIGHGYVVYFTPWFFLPSFWVHPSPEHRSSLLSGTYCMVEPWGWMENIWRSMPEILCGMFQKLLNCSSPILLQIVARKMPGDS